MTPSNTIDHVVANAGIAIEDEVFSYDGTAIHQLWNSTTTKPLSNTDTQDPTTRPNRQTSKRST
jgi:hypothetical protein